MQNTHIGKQNHFCGLDLLIKRLVILGQRPKLQLNSLKPVYTTTKPVRHVALHTWTLTLLQLMISTMPTTSSNTRFIFLQASDGRNKCKPKKKVNWPVKPPQNGQNCAAVLTDGDGVDFALDLQRAVVAVEGVNDLFGLRVVNRQVTRSLLVLLQKARGRGVSEFGSY